MGVLIFGALVHANTVISSPKLFHSKCSNPMGLGLNTSHAHYRAMWDLIGLPQYVSGTHETPSDEAWREDMEARGAHYIFRAHRLRSGNMLFPYEQVIKAVQKYLFPKNGSLSYRNSCIQQWNHDVSWLEAADCLWEFYDDHLIEMRAQCRNVTHIAILP